MMIYRVINERLSPVVWHFCWFDALSSILRTNSFRLSESHVDRDALPGVTGYSEKRPYYMCTTRSKNSSEGYSKIVSDDNREGYARIQLDGDALNSVVHAKASDYFGSRSDDDIAGKRALYKGIERGHYKGKTVNDIYAKKYSPIQDNEKEDTIWYNQPIIPNANRCIQRIDVLIPTEESMKENAQLFKVLRNNAARLNIPIYFYTNQKDMDLQRDNHHNITETTNKMKTGRRIVKITEEQYNWFVNSIDEAVYVSDLNRKKKTANITYQQGGGRMYGNKKKGDFLKTDKMDTKNSDTYEVPLKGGLMSYNITSINGTEVMHYFKRVFDNQSTYVKDGEGEQYKLEMQDLEFRQFMENFVSKIDYVVKFAIENFRQKNPQMEFGKCYVYPVPSSSRFNVEMAKRMAYHHLGGLTVETLNPSMLRKDLKNLQFDQDFIDKNKEYYNSPRGNKFAGTHMDHAQEDSRRMEAWNNILSHIDITNQLADQLTKLYYQRRKNINNPNFYKRFADVYIRYANEVSAMEQAGQYDSVDKQHSIRLQGMKGDGPAPIIKYSKPQAVSRRSKEIYATLKSMVPDMMNGIKPVDIVTRDRNNFQIKKFGNDTRMALKNIFQPNSDEQDMVKQEVDRAKGANVVIVFDDNVSGGATLADICYQLKQLGLQFVIPITFGKMGVSWGSQMTGVINQPKNGFNMD